MAAQSQRNTELDTPSSSWRLAIAEEQDYRILLLLKLVMSAKSCVIPRIMCKWEFVQPPEELIKREVSGCSHDFAHSLQAAPGG